MESERPDEQTQTSAVNDVLRNVPRRAPRPLHEPTWVARRLGWIADLVARLDPDPLARRWQRLSEPLTLAFGRALEPVADRLSGMTDGDGPLGRAIQAMGLALGLALLPASRLLDRIGRVFHTAVTSTDRALESLLVRLPLPRWLRKALWIPPFDALQPTEAIAQARVKAAYATVLSVGILSSVAAHFVAFQLTPDFEVEDVSFHAEELNAVEIPPEIEIPPPPQAVARPATPVISDLPIDEDVTIAATTFADNPVEELPPPPNERSTASGDGGGAERRPTFTPFTVAPEIRNRSELSRLIGEHYPPNLRDVGIGGVVVVWFHIDDAGHVTDTRIAQTSGHPKLDTAALEVSDLFVFSPALNNDQHVPVWVQFPITFAVR